MKEITSLQHPLIKHLAKLRQNSDYRYDHHSMIIEGSKLIQEASDLCDFKTILTVDPGLIPSGIKADEVILTTSAIIQKISGMHSSDGILAETPMPNNTNLKGKKYIVALDGVSDPGNLGTIMRTALALGWEGIFFLEESCDPYNDKALRASRGAIFKLPMIHGSWKDLQNLIQENKLTAYVADTQGTPIQQISSPEGILLVLGNEAHGPSEETRLNCGALTIPMPGQMESLNVSVAAGILLYTLRQR